MIEEVRLTDRKQLTQMALEISLSALALRSGESRSLLASGGSTPLPLYRSLSEQAIDWSNITIGLVDERWVEADHPDSNGHAVTSCLLSGEARRAQFLTMKGNAERLSSAVADCNKRYEHLFDSVALTVLGMGEDGHTASWFPESNGLFMALEGSDLCYGIEAKKSPVTGDNTRRLTLGLKAILNSRRILLLLTGEKKWQVYQAAKDSDDILGLPLAALLANHEQTHIQVLWAP